MVKGTFGIVMSYYRDKYDLQQTAIYEGICSAASYSRAEMEERNVDFVVIEALLARIGMKPERFEFMLRNKDFALWSERQEMQAALEKHDFDMVGNKLREYREKMPADNKLHEQFCRYYQLKLEERKLKSPDILCQEACEALSITKNKEDMPHRRRNLYTYMEMDLLLTLIHHRYGKWADPHRAKDCLESILDAVKIWTAPEMRAALEGRVWLELLELTEQYDKDDSKLFEYARKAIACLSKSDRIGMLATAHFINAKLLWRIQNGTQQEANAKENHIQLAREECRMAYSIFQALGWEPERKEVADHCREVLQWHITM